MIKPGYKYSELKGKLIGCSVDAHNALGSAILNLNL